MRKSIHSVDEWRACVRDLLVLSGMSSSEYLCPTCIVIVQEHDGLAFFLAAAAYVRVLMSDGEKQRKRRRNVCFVFCAPWSLDVKVRVQGNLFSLNVYRTVRRNRMRRKECSQVEGTTSFTVAGTSSA